MLHALIMAGGSGKRFWPESRRRKPKPLIPFFEGHSLLQETLRRLEGLLPPERILIIANRDHLELIRAQAPEFPTHNLIGEPSARDTAPCITLGTLLIERRDPQAEVLVLPADHLIRPAHRFQQAVRAASQAVRETPCLLVFGLRPTSPATGYGYLRRGRHAREVAGFHLHLVEQFVEKPDLETATRYLASGDYFWNSGIFLWKVRSIIDALAKYAPDLLEAFAPLRHAPDHESLASLLDELYGAARRTSIDYAVMENASNTQMIEADFEWNDAGTWLSLEAIHGRDRDTNVVSARHCGLDTANCILVGGDHLIATVGVKDLIVVHTQDATLVCHRDRAEEVKELCKLLRQQGLGQYLE